MKRVKTILGLLVAPLILVAAPIGMTAAANLPSPPQEKPHKRVCGNPAQFTASCNAHVVVDGKSGKPAATVAYASGYASADLASAYKLPALPAAGSTFAWNGQTVAIVDAYDNPNAAADLLAYRRQFNLPLCATANPTPTVNDLVGCLFTKVNQNGQASPMPVGNTGWGQEIDLDVQMVAAICPQCKILLVEGNSNSYADLVAAVDRAAVMGANAISNSYGSNEFSTETSSAYNAHYNHPGIAITVSAGDSGYGAQFPAASQYVTAVGGTSLTRNGSVRGWTESAWSGTGSGCSAYINRPSWQPAVGTCTKRVIGDVSAVANPSTGVAVYDSYGSAGGANWFVFGGTSVSAPIIAGVYALAGNAGAGAPGIQYGEFAYSHAANLFDVTSGSNGRCTVNKRSSANLALCTAIPGFDGPTGLGSPNGSGAF